MSGGVSALPGSPPMVPRMPEMDFINAMSLQKIFAVLTA
jgi:hypothetical protein